MVKKRLYRSEDDRMIGGVCGGIAEYFDVDPVLIRAIAVILLFLGGGFLAYLVLWIIVPIKSDVLKVKKVKRASKKKV